MSLSAGRSSSQPVPHDAFTAVAAVNHPPHSALALWQAVNTYQRPRRVSTLRTITNPLSLCVFLFPSARSPVFSAMFEHEMEESKKVSGALDSVVPVSPLWRVWNVYILIFLTVASGSAHLWKCVCTCPVTLCWLQLRLSGVLTTAICTILMWFLGLWNCS